MVKLIAFALSASLALVGLAHAQSPQVPNPSNPYPANPIATDGSSLLPSGGRGYARGNWIDGLFLGRSNAIAIAPPRN